MQDAVDCPEWIVPFHVFKSLAEEVSITVCEIAKILVRHTTSNCFKISVFLCKHWNAKTSYFFLIKFIVVYSMTSNLFLQKIRMNLCTSIWKNQNLWSSCEDLVHWGMATKIKVNLNAFAIYFSTTIKFRYT